MAWLRCVVAPAEMESSAITALTRLTALPPSLTCPKELLPLRQSMKEWAAKGVPAPINEMLSTLTAKQLPRLLRLGDQLAGEWVRLSTELLRSVARPKRSFCGRCGQVGGRRDDAACVRCRARRPDFLGVAPHGPARVCLRMPAPSLRGGARACVRGRLDRLCCCFAVVAAGKIGAAAVMEVVKANVRTGELVDMRDIPVAERTMELALQLLGRPLAEDEELKEGALQSAAGARLAPAPVRLPPKASQGVQAFCARALRSGGAPGMTPRACVVVRAALTSWAWPPTALPACACACPRLL